MDECGTAQHSITWGALYQASSSFFTHHGVQGSGTAPVFPHSGCWAFYNQEYPGHHGRSETQRFLEKLLKAPVWSVTCHFCLNFIDQSGSYSLPVFEMAWKSNPIPQHKNKNWKLQSMSLVTTTRSMVSTLIYQLLTLVKKRLFGVIFLD